MVRYLQCTGECSGRAFVPHSNTNYEPAQYLNQPYFALGFKRSGLRLVWLRDSARVPRKENPRRDRRLYILTP